MEQQQPHAAAMRTTYFDPDIDFSRQRTSFLDTYLRNREYGFHPKYGDQSRLNRELYTSIQPISKWENDRPIMNMEFSPDGSILVAVCKDKGIELFDPLTQKHITSTKKSHNGNFSCIKFVDPRIFATCNDRSITLWDVRCLKNNLRMLEGSYQMVNSCMDYSAKDKLLITSSMDGNIHTWDINRYTEQGRFANNPVGFIDGIRQIKFLPDASKLVASTDSGFILLINNLDLETLRTDINGFKQKDNFLMKMNRTTVPDYLHMFTRKRNRLEFIVDFPAQEIFSIQVHPQGLNVLSRSITTNFRDQCTCVHDIQDSAIPSNLDEHEEISHEGANSMNYSLADDLMEANLHRRTHVIPRDINSLIPLYLLKSTSGDLRSDWYSVIDCNLTGAQPSSAKIDLSTLGVAVVYLVNQLRGCYLDPNYFRTYQVPLDHKIYKYSKRLTHFIEESNMGRFFKNPGYSSDGRIICSPFYNGVRLLSISPNYDELSSIPPNPPCIFVIGSNMSHSKVVSCTKFSPIHPVLVSGCVSGRIVWYQPRL